jgi:two-component system, cell cycle sensor histidine kinase and response regulator CckA
VKSNAFDRLSLRSILVLTITASFVPFLIMTLFPSQFHYVMDRALYLLFHNITEFFSIMVALSIFGVGWYTYSQSGNRHALFLSTAFLAIGLLDFMHALGNAAMPAFVTPNSSNKSTQFWIAARFFSALSFLLSAYIYPNRQPGWLPKALLSRTALLLTAVAIPALVFTGISFFPSYVPDTFVPGVGLTAFKVFSEYLVICLLCMAAAAYWRRMAQTGEKVLIYYVAAFVICIFSELVFAGYKTVFDTYNVLGHIYKIAAFCLIYKGIFVASVRNPYVELFDTNRQLDKEIGERKQAEHALLRSKGELELRVKERTADLRDANERLRVELGERMKAEEAVRESEERWATTLASIGDGVIATDAEGRIAFINAVAEDLTGWKLSEALGRPVAEVFHIINEESRQTVDSPVVKVLSEGMIVGLANHTILVRKDGTEVPIGDSGAPIKGRDGEATGVVLVFRDISHRKRIEEALSNARDELELRVKERTVELQEAYGKLEVELVERGRLEGQLRQAHKMEALGTLTGGIAHDFNNILAAILGFAEMSLDDVPPGTLLEKNLGHILNSSFRARDLIRQMLTFSRRTEYEAKPLLLTPIIKETAKLLRASIPTTIQIDVKTTATSDAIYANPTGVQQIIMNLSTNAAYSMRETGGKLGITLSDAIVLPGQGLPPGAYLRLDVQDTGTGIDTDVMKRIFEPFFTTKEPGQGTGMGLAVVYGIVKSLKGDIAVESRPGAGSVFRVLFPKIDKGEVPEAPGFKDVPKGTEHVLFIDDEEALTELGTGMLERLGYRVTATTKSSDALRLFSEDPTRFDLVITDQTMPELTGVRLAERLLAIRADVPVILCTGHSETVSPERAREVGIREFIMKPLARQELAAAIRRVLDARPVVPSTLPLAP